MRRHPRATALLTALALAVAACGDSQGGQSGTGLATATTITTPSDATAGAQPSTTTTTPPPDPTATPTTRAEEGDPVDDTAPTDRTLPPGRTPDTVPEIPPPVVGEAPGDLLESILADAAARTGASAADLTVTRAEAVAWNDGSLGCAIPGEVYLQVIVFGYWVQVEAPGHFLDYRADDRGFFKLCESPMITPPPTSAPSS